MKYIASLISRVVASPACLAPAESTRSGTQRDKISIRDRHRSRYMIRHGVAQHQQPNIIRRVHTPEYMKIRCLKRSYAAPRSGLENIESQTARIMGLNAVKTTSGGQYQS